jgi:hypothetical protein
MTSHKESSAPAKHGFKDNMNNMLANIGLKQRKEQTHISALEDKITNRQKQFGVDYLNLVKQNSFPGTLKKCLSKALKDISKLEKEVNEHHDNVDSKTEKVKEKSVAAKKPKKKTKEDRPENTLEETKESPRPATVVAKPKRNDTDASKSDKTDKKRTPKTEETKESPRPATVVAKPKRNDTDASKSDKTDKKMTPKTEDKAKPAAANHSASGGTNKTTDAADEYSDADASRWKLSELIFAGSVSFETMGKKEEVRGKCITKGIKKFKANPGKYLAMTYQTDDLKYPKDKHEYTFIHRAGTKKYQPQGLSTSGWMTLLLQEYQQLMPLEDNILPKQFRDKYTDNMSYGGYKLHSKKNRPILPGRGMGVGDSPNLKIIGDVDPSDISQGSVGDCWLLSGISSLAEFDGAIKHLFRKTKKLDKMPRDRPNMYTITLWDLPTWTEVDIMVDERLCVTADGSGNLLASKPSEDGELWVCYLEKALAAHCGGWDKITGGQCTHAWALMTGCKEQYEITKNKKTGKYICMAKYNPYEKKWLKHGNSPHDNDKAIYRVAWPEVGGGGGIDKELDEEELFLKLCAWDDVNYIVGAGTTGTSDKNRTDGMVDNHAYSVIESVNNVAGTGFGLIKVRNPWGKGEIEDGLFDDDGPGWDKYPQIKKALNPVVADDGIFWVTKQEFFKYFQTIYLSASNMTEFLED